MGAMACMQPPIDDWPITRSVIAMTMDVKRVEADAQLDMSSGVLVQLRSRFEKDGLMAQIREPQQGGYQLAYVESDGTVLYVAGFVVST